MIKIQLRISIRIAFLKCSFVLQFIKIAMPHIGLYFFLFLYLIGGAWTFARYILLFSILNYSKAFKGKRKCSKINESEIRHFRVERSADREYQLNKLQRINKIYVDLTERISNICPRSSDHSHFRSKFFESLQK